MATVVDSQCAAGTALSATSLTLALNQDIPQSDLANGRALLVYYALWSAAGGGFTLSDDGATPGVGYLGQPNVEDPSIGNSIGGFLGSGVGWAFGMIGYVIRNPLLTGEHLIVDFGGVSVDYFRTSVFPAEEIVLGDCDIQSNFVTGASAAGTGDGGSTGVFVPSPANWASYAFGAVATPGIGSIAFNDGGITVLDSWLNDGPLSDTSFICGYQSVTPDVFPATHDIGGHIDVSIPPTGPGSWGYSGTFYEGGVGYGYCIEPPTGGNPCFNRVIPV